MTRARGGAIAAILVLLIGAVVVARSVHREPSKAVNNPVLLLLTSLPLVFNEDFSIDGGGSTALTALRSHYWVLPISTTDATDLAKGRLLVMAHPLAQTAENLVELDKWVRSGGRVLLLADPMLEWPSKRSLGDPLRPPAMFADTGLLAHWGLRLNAPERRGVKKARLGDYEILTATPGTLSGKGCAISPDGLVAHGRVGRGRATIIADADLLDPRDLGEGAEHNLDAILSEISDLRH